MSKKIVVEVTGYRVRSMDGRRYAYVAKTATECLVYCYGDINSDPTEPFPTLRRALAAARKWVREGGKPE